LDTVYKKIEVVGVSKESIEEAIHNAIERAGQTVHNMRWFEVVEQRGRVHDGEVDQFQVTLKIGFRLN
jgi:flavin-binding protein dodecin